MLSITLAIRLFFLLISINSILCRNVNDQSWYFENFYQLNIKYFKDSNDDGIGDINGKKMCK